MTRSKKPPTISETLRSEALATGLSTYRLALDCGISQPVLHRFIQDGSGLKLANVDRLAAHLGLQLIKGSK